MSGVTKEMHFYTTTAALLGGIFCWYKTIGLQLQIIKQKIQRMKITQYPEVDINSVQQYLDESTNETTNIFVIGLAQQDQGNDSWISFNKEEVIYQLSVKRPLYSTSSFEETVIDFKQQPDSLINRIYSPYFKLSNKDTKQKIQIRLRNECDVESALIYLGKKDDLRRLSFSERLINYFSLWCFTAIKVLGHVSLTSAVTGDLGFKGIHLGYRESQFGVKAGGWLSVLGKVVYDKSKGFSIQNPILLTLSKEHHLKFLTKKIQQLQQKRNIYLIGAGILTIYVGRRTFVYYQQNSQKVQSLIDRVLRFLGIKDHKAVATISLNQI